MIFLGDLACPPEKVREFNEAVEKLDILEGQTVIINLEAVIHSGQIYKSETLYNHESVLDALLKKSRKVIVSLANNHLYDYPGEILSTKSLLESKGIGVFGLMDKDGGFSPYEYEDENGAYAIFGHCWDLYTATNPNLENDIRIVDCPYDIFYREVERYASSNPLRKVFCFMHWNYDLEKMPFPMLVRLSHDLIDIGVEGVIGSHSHVTHDVEIYKNKAIAYCLGNFYLPSGIYFDKQLIYPEESKMTFGIRIDGKRIEVLRFETDKEVPVRFIDAVIPEELFRSAITNVEDYKKYFRKNRAKRFLVPVYNRYAGFGYNLNRTLGIHRVKIIKKILKLIHR